MSVDKPFAPPAPVAAGMTLGSWTTVALAGEIDLVSAPTVLSTVLGASEEGDAGVVIDLSAVDFIDIAGVRALVLARDHLRSEGRDLLLRRPSPLLVRMLGPWGATDMVEEERVSSRPGRDGATSRGSTRLPGGEGLSSLYRSARTPRRR
jgi:anti-anti-sigma factor